LGAHLFVEARDDALRAESACQKATMSHHRDGRRRLQHQTPDSQTHWRLLGHVMVTILLALAAAVAVWIVLGSDATPGDAGQSAVTPARILGMK
jgi:disulfide bond formation protein DsbB